MRCAAILAFASLAASPALAQPLAQPYVPPSATYVVAGQDIAGYRAWVAASPRHALAVAAYAEYLRAAGVGEVVPIWQLARTASQWHRCGQPAFEVPPTEVWDQIVNTLRFVRDHVIPAVGAVEALSAYRNPLLNSCAGGSPNSAHQQNIGVDLIPLYPFERNQLMSRLCTVHARAGLTSNAGLGFYVGIRFHIDVWKYRAWGITAEEGGDQCAIALERREEARVKPVERGY